VPRILAVLFAPPDTFLSLATSPTSYLVGRLKLKGWPGDLAVILTPLNLFLWHALFGTRRRISLRRPPILGDAGDTFDEELLDLYTGIRTMIKDSCNQHPELVHLEPAMAELYSCLQKESYSASLTATGKILEAVLSSYGRANGADLAGRQLARQVETLGKLANSGGKVARLRPLLDLVRIYRNLGAHHGEKIHTRVDVLLALMALAQCLELVLPVGWFTEPGNEIPMSE
jgi:hypothetical protein